jgi:hypothetical protein
LLSSVPVPCGSVHVFQLQTLLPELFLLTRLPLGRACHFSCLLLGHVVHLGPHLGLHLEIGQVHLAHLRGQPPQLLCLVFGRRRGGLLCHALPLRHSLGEVSFILRAFFSCCHLGHQPVICCAQVGRFGRCPCLLSR